MKLSVEERPEKESNVSKIFLATGFAIMSIVIVGLTTMVIKSNNEPPVVETKIVTVIVTMVEDPETQEVIPEVQTETHAVCNPNATFKSYMDYRTITNTASPQYQLQQLATSENGIRYIDDRMMIAIANYKVGDKLDLTLSSGIVLKVIVGDVKGSTSCIHPDGSLFEIIVDKYEMDQEIRKVYGNYDRIFKGTVTSIAFLKGDAQ